MMAAEDNNSFTQAGGADAYYVAMWDGSSWSPLGSGMDEPVIALAIGPGNVLYAGGDFTLAGGVSANNVAKWESNSWSPLGIGMDNNDPNDNRNHSGNRKNRNSYLG